MAMPNKTLTYVVKHSDEKAELSALAKGVDVPDEIFGVIESVADTTPGQRASIGDQPDAEQFEKHHMQFLYDGSVRQKPIKSDGWHVDGPIIMERLRESEHCTLRADEIGAIIKLLEQDESSSEGKRKK